jgi:hypothetical protein
VDRVSWAWRITAAGKEASRFQRLAANLWAMQSDRPQHAESDAAEIPAAETRQLFTLFAVTGFTGRDSFAILEPCLPGLLVCLPENSPATQHHSRPVCQSVHSFLSSFPTESPLAEFFEIAR